MFKAPVAPLQKSKLDELIATHSDDWVGFGSEWRAATERYAEAWLYYSGEIFKKTLPNSDELLYPLGINLISLTCRMHGLFLWGQYQQGQIVTLSPITTRTKMMRPQEDAGEERAEQDPEVKREREQGLRMAEFFNGLLRANTATTLFREQGRMFAVFGGSYFKLRYDPTNRFGITLDAPPPANVYPVWHPMDYRKLLRVHLESNIPVSMARKFYGYKANAILSSVTLRETWEEDNYVVTVNDEPAIDPFTGEKMAGCINLIDPLTQQHILPWVYIPRLPTGSFYGISLPVELAAMQDEINSRMADQGDAVTIATHGQLWGHDLTRRRGKEPMRLNAGEIFDAGETPPGGVEPFIGVLPAPDISNGVSAYVETLTDRVKEHAQLTPVTFGEDEGSQRSAETLNTRAVPTTLLIDDYRANWGTGIGQLFRIATIMSSAAKINEADIGWLDRFWEIEFAPILPKDRAGVVQEVVTKYSAGLISLRRALELLPDVPDVEAELEQLMAEQREKQEREAEKAEVSHQRALELSERKSALNQRKDTQPNGRHTQS